MLNTVTEIKRDMSLSCALPNIAVMPCLSRVYLRAAFECRQ
jgi:hypothetical protein